MAHEIQKTITISLFFIVYIAYVSFGFYRPKKQTKTCKMRNKSIFIFFATAIYYSVAYSQSPVTSEALSKMMLDYYNFTIVGSQTPTTGFKVETNKPSITLKGNIFSNRYRRFVANLELEGGLENGLMQLISGKDVNSYFKGSVGFNFLRPKNIASHYVLTKTEYQLTYNAFHNNRMLLARQLDTFFVIKVITDDSLFRKYTFSQFKNAVVAESKVSEYQIKSLTRQYPVSPDAYYHDLIKGVLVSYGTATSSTDDILLNNFRTSVDSVNSTTIKTKKILEDYDRIKESLLKEENTLNDKQYDFEIALTKVNWTWKKIKWWNVSLSAVNSNFKLYNSGNNNLLDSNSFLPSLSVSFNWLWKGKEANRFHYIKLGGTVQKANSLIDLQKFNYKKETTITVNPGEELKSTKEGTAYMGELVEKTGFDVFIEAFSVPWTNQFIPGIYLKTVYRNSEAWINKNKISLDLGTVWNVNNNDKDAKNVLTIVPFISWSNLLKEYKDLGKTQERKLSDLFSFNVKFGIPINIGKQ